MKHLYEKIKNINYINVNNWWQQCENLFINSNIRSQGNCILISQFNGIGDAILISGVIKEIKNHYNLPIIIACNDFAASIFKINPYIDKVITIKPIDIKLDKNLNTFKYLIDKIYNELWANNFFIKEAFHFQCFELNHVAMLFNYLSGAKKKISFNEYSINKNELTDKEQNILKENINIYTKLFTTNVYQFPKNITHMVDRHYYLLEQYLNKNFIHDLYIYPQPTNIIKYMNKNKKNIVISLGGSLKSKQYPPKQLNQFLSKINNENIILIGGKDINTKDINCNCIDLVGKTSLIESIDLINSCDLYIGNDSGMTHIAAACKKPCIVFYKESIDSYEYFPERLSSYLQFKPYNTLSVCLRPKRRLNPCNKKVYVYNGCLSDNQYHCIRQIRIEDIKKAYNELINLVY